MTDVTMTDLRRLLLLVQTLHSTLEGDDVWRALGASYRDDEWLLAIRDGDGTPHPSWAKSEIEAALRTLGALAGPRPDKMENTQ